MTVLLGAEDDAGLPPANSQFHVIGLPVDRSVKKVLSPAHILVLDTANCAFGKEPMTRDEE